MERREFFGTMLSGLASIATACGPVGDGSLQVVDQQDGRVLHWERDDLVVLVTGAAQRYAPGDTMRLNVMLNNQGSAPILVKVRMKVLGRGMQPVVEAPVSNLSVAPEAAAAVDRELALPTTLTPGDYTLQVEIPPWEVEQTRRTTGGGTFSVTLQIGN